MTANQKSIQKRIEELEDQAQEYRADGKDDLYTYCTERIAGLKQALQVEEDARKRRNHKSRQRRSALAEYGIVVGRKE